MPVYLHYCGGNLEEISYLVKTSNCCGEEESEEEASDCCRNEHFYLKYNPDFSFQQQKTNFSALGKGSLNAEILTACHLNILPSHDSELTIQKHFPPPKIYQKTLLHSTFMRI